MKEGTLECAIWRPDATSYVVRVAGEDVRFPLVGEDLDTTRAYYPSELAAMLAEAIEDDAPGSITTCTAAVDTDTGVLTLTFDAAAVIAWTHANTTLDSVYTFGFDVTADTASATSHAGALTMPGYWTPRHKPDDPADRADVVQAVAESLSGITRGQYFANSRRKLDLSWRHLLPSEVLEEEATDAHNVFDYVWANAITRGRKFRVYDSGNGYREYQMRPGSPEEPYARNGTRAYFWDVTVLARRTTAPGVSGSEETVPVIDTFTVDAGSSATVRAGASVTFGWTTTGADTVEIDGGVGAVTPAAGGTQGWTSVEGATVYTLTATNGAGSVTAQVTVTGVADVILAQDWDILYDSKDANAGAHTWAAAIHPGSAGDYELAHAGDSGNRPNYAFDTGALAEGLAGIGPERIDKAIRLDVSSNTTSGFVGATASQDWTSFFSEGTDSLRLSMLLYVGSVTNGRRVLAVEDTTTEYWRVASLSSSRFSYSARADSDGGTNSYNTDTNTYATPGWYLVEWVFRGRYWDLYQNGVAILSNSDRTDDYRPTVASIRLCLMGAVNGSVSDDLGIMYAGFKGLGSSGTYSLSEHQAFAEAIGLYTPP